MEITLSTSTINVAVDKDTELISVIKKARDPSITPSPNGICDINPTTIDKQYIIARGMKGSSTPNAKATNQILANSNVRAKNVIANTENDWNAVIF